MMQQISKPSVQTSYYLNSSVNNFGYPEEVVIKIYLTEQLAYSTTITIFNSLLEKISESNRDFSWDEFLVSYKTVPGKYTIRLQINGRITDNYLNVYDDTTCSVGNIVRKTDEQLKLPELYSSAPLLGELSYASSHEYYTAPAIRLSDRDSTTDFWIIPPTSGLFIFLRFSSQETYLKTENPKEIWANFKLLDYKGHPFISFPNHSVHDDNDTENQGLKVGYMGFSALLMPGMYFLQYDGSERRTVPVYVYKDWYTQLFMTVGEQPLFGSLRIFLSRERRFNPFNKLHYYIDICLDKITNGDFTLDEHLLNKIAHGKWESPMLGLLGAYIYLNSNERKNDNLFQTIVYNLKNSILQDSYESPDIWALNLLSYRHFNRAISFDETALNPGLPMMRSAFDAIRQAASVYPQMVREGGLLDHIAENQAFDSAYNTFFSLNNNTFTNLLSYDGATNSSPIYVYPTIMDYLNDGLQKYLDNTGENEKIISPVKSRLPDLLKDRSKIGRTGGAIINALINDPSLDNFKIAQQLTLPINTVTRLRKELDI